MDRNTVVWWIFDPPTKEEQDSLDAMKYHNVVWANDGLEYSIFEDNPMTKDAALNLVNRLQQFAKKHNASAIIGRWNNGLYDVIKYSHVSRGIRCYSSRTISNLRTGANRHKFILIGEI